jgi:hypothetical protein
MYVVYDAAEGHLLYLRPAWPPRNGDGGAPVPVDSARSTVHLQHVICRLNDHHLPWLPCYG